MAENSADLSIICDQRLREHNKSLHSLIDRLAATERHISDIEDAAGIVAFVDSEEKVRGILSAGHVGLVKSL